MKNLLLIFLCCQFLFVACSQIPYVVPQSNLINAIIETNRLEYSNGEPIIVNVYVENLTKNDIKVGQFSPFSSAFGTPVFIIKRIPDGDEVRIYPGFYKESNEIWDDWENWYQPSSGIEAYKTSWFILPSRKRIHILSGDLRRLLEMAHVCSINALKENYQTNSKGYYPKGYLNNRQKYFKKVLFFTDEFQKGGLFELYVEAYVKSNIIRIQIENKKH